MMKRPTRIQQPTMAPADDNKDVAARKLMFSTNHVNLHTIPLLGIYLLRANFFGLLTLAMVAALFTRSRIPSTV